MPRVFVTNEPLRVHTATQKEQRMMDFTPAREFGEIIHLTPAGRLPNDSSAVCEMIETSMTEHDFQENDYLLTVGDMRAIVAASGIAAMMWGRVNLLVWRGYDRAYDAVTIDFPEMKMPVATGNIEGFSR